MTHGHVGILAAHDRRACRRGGREDRRPQGGLRQKTVSLPKTAAKSAAKQTDTSAAAARELAEYRAQMAQAEAASRRYAAANTPVTHLPTKPSSVNISGMSDTGIWQGTTKTPPAQRGEEILRTPIGASGITVLVNPGAENLGLGVLKYPEAPDLGLGVQRTPVAGQRQIIDANTEPSTPEQVAADLPVWKKGDRTVGQVVQDIGDGNVIKVGGTVKSGASPQSAAIDDFLKEALRENEYPSSGNFAAITHVEIKGAWYMRNGGPDYMEIVINYPDGPCDGDYSCSIAVPQILKPGQEMKV